MVTLPVDARAVRHARALLRRELAAQLDDDGMTVAVLLVSELVTNAVVHAASEIELFWDCDGGCVTVRVRDADTGPLPARSPSDDELAEDGRGLLIVDQLAQAWGTEHDSGRKTVWFRLPAAADRRRRTTAGTAEPGATSGPAAEEPAALRVAQRRLGNLVLPEKLHFALPFHRHVAEVLARVADAVGAVGGEVRSATGETLAGYGDTVGSHPWRYQLGLAGRPLGSLLIRTSDERRPHPEAEAFLRIAAERLALLAYEQGVLRADHGRAAEQGYLAQATEMLTATLSMRTTLTLLPQLVVPRLGDWCVAYLADERRRLTRVATNHVHEDSIEALTRQVDQDEPMITALRQATESGRPLRLPATPHRDTSIVLPITSRTRTLAAVVVGRRRQLDATSSASLTELARRAALAMDNARLHEEQADAATALQAALLPPALPEVDGVELAARYHSASPGLMVGGDFYDAFALADGSLICAVGDVCGKGAEAASVTGMSRDLIRLLLRDGRTLSGALQRLNRALLEDAAGSRFCTVALTRLERDGDIVRACVCLAGHPEPVLVRASGETDVVGVPGDLLGVIPGKIALTESAILLHPGDTLVLYTDGVSERRDGARMFGLAGIRHCLGLDAGRDAASIALNLEQAARSFADTELRDDLAILAVHRHARSPQR